MTKNASKNVADLLAMAREVTPTDIDCPRCATEGVKTVSGATPKLRKDGGKLKCMGTHGIISDSEIG